MTPSQLLSGLKTTLSAHLGKYSTPAGSVPAIFVGTRLPANYTMDATFTRFLECVIHPTTEGPLIRENYRAVEMEGAYRVVIKDWSPVLAPERAPTGVGAARDAVLAAWRTTGNPVLVHGTDETLEQVTILIRNV